MQKLNAQKYNVVQGHLSRNYYHTKNCTRNSRDLQYKEFTLQTYNVHAMLTFLVWKCSPTSIIQIPLAMWTSQGFG